MGENMKSVVKLAALTVALCCLTACASSRSVVMPTLSKTDNPVQGPTVKIVTVVDQRKFEVNPRDPSQPSIGSASDIANPAITARAIGRKRNGYGMAMGDVLLPDNVTVSDLLRDSAINAFHRSGYRVVKQGDADYDTAAPVDICIKQFWSWFTPGFVSITVENRVVVEIKAPLKGFETSALVNATVSDGSMAAFESDWQKIATRGVADFEKNLQAQLPKP
jgi:hypothetical protein